MEQKKTAQKKGAEEAAEAEQPTAPEPEPLPEPRPGHKSVQAAKLAVMREAGYCQKQRTPGLNYSYAGEAALIEAIRPAMIEAGLTLHPLNVEIIHAEIYETRGGGKMKHIRTRSTYRLYHADSDTFEDIIVLGEAADSGDKSCPKALTIAYKYALRQAFVIETGDDPDKYPSEPEVTKSEKEAKAAKQKPAAPARRPAGNLANGGTHPAVTEADLGAGPDAGEPEGWWWEHVIETEGSAFCGKRVSDIAHTKPEWLKVVALDRNRRAAMTEKDARAVVQAWQQLKNTRPAAPPSPAPSESKEIPPDFDAYDGEFDPPQEK